MGTRVHNPLINSQKHILQQAKPFFYSELGRREPGAETRGIPHSNAKEDQGWIDTKPNQVETQNEPDTTGLCPE
jgi:hypothetical protein